MNANPVLPAISGLVMDFDFSKGSSVVTASGKVASITDQTGSVVSSQVTPTLQPTYTNNTGAGNNGFATFTGTESLTGGLITASTNLTMYIVRRVSTGSTIGDNMGVFQNGNGSTGYGWGEFLASSNSDTSGMYYAGVSSLPCQYAITNNNRWEIVAMSHSTGNSKSYNTLGSINLPTRQDLDPITPAGGHTIGGVAALNKFKGDITRILLYTRQHTDNEVTTICSYLQSRYALALPTHLVTGGDSITATAQGSLINNWPTYTLKGLLPTKYLYLQQTGVSGRVTDDIIANLTAEVLSQYQPKVKNIYCLQIGHNDMNNGTAIGCYNNIVSILSSVKAAGYTTVLNTLLNTAAYANSRIDAVNTMLRANASTICDVFIDINLRTNLLDPTNITYYFDQLTHLSYLGAQDFATGEQAGIIALI